MMLTSLADWLTDAALTVRTTPGWAGRGPTPFDPEGVVIHHTASRPDADAPTINAAINGRPGLPGPLYQLLVGRSGTVWVIAAGRANHAGVGSWRGLTGNRSVIGIAGENTGTGEAWPAVQYRAMVTATAVLCQRLGIPTALVCGHKEWTPRKIDPAGIDMNQFRLDVFARLLDLEGQPTPMTPVEQAQAAINAWLDPVRRIHDVFARLLDLEGQPDNPTPIPEATPMTPVEQAQAAINAWLDPVRRIRVDGDWGPASTAALVHVLDVVVKPQLDGHTQQVSDLRATVDALRQRVADLQAAGEGNRATPRLVALATIGAETARWVENVASEIAKLDQIPE